MNKERPPLKHFLILLSGIGWGLIALAYQSGPGWIAYPNNYGLNTASILWALWSMPATIGIIFGPFFLSILVLHSLGSTFFTKEETN